MATNVLELHRFDRAPDPRALIDLVTVRDRAAILPAALGLAREVRRLGLRLMLWDDLSQLAPMVDASGTALNTAVFGWDEDTLAPWQCRERALHNPVLRACRMESEPFLIDGSGVRGIWADPLPARGSQGDFAARTGFAAAIVVPVHLPFGQIGAAVLSAADPAAGLDDVFDTLPDTLAPAIRRFVRGYVGLCRDTRYLPPACQLSPREVECLSWIAQGKTDYEISIILGCSHAGVRYHITRACERLNAVNRAQSVFRASQLGYIGPGAP